tara:strand:- start:11528 stop:12244 length:717 start_codon:yes stop_codon:yes gene_type:complete
MNNKLLEKIGVVGVFIVAALVAFNQLQIMSVTGMLGGTGGGFMSGSSSSHVKLLGNTDLADVDVSTIESTAQGIAALYPVNQIKTSEDAISIMISTGTPDYGEAMGVSFDDPVASMEAMAAAYRALDQQAKQDPEVWQRYIDLASNPRGVSCEFCCGVGPAGATKEGKSKCGCKHNPAVLALTQWLLMNTEYTDAEILKEVYDWKSLFFPRDMVGLATKIGGGDTSVLEELPGMVGGC